MMLLTVASVYKQWVPTPPVQSVASPSQAQTAQQGTWAKSLERDWDGLTRNLSPIIGGSMSLFAAVLYFLARRRRSSAPSADGRTGQSIQDHPQLKQMGHVALSLEPSKPPPDDGITVGTRVRLCSPLTDADRHRFPGWIDEMDAHVGQEFVVQSCASNGLLQLEGLRPKVCVAWVEPSSQVARVHAK